MLSGSAGCATLTRCAHLSWRGGSPGDCRRRSGPRCSIAMGHFVPWEEGFDFTPPALGPGEIDRTAGFRRARGPEGRHQLVVRAHRSTIPGSTNESDLPKERHYLSQLRRRAVRRARGPPLPRLVPPSRRDHHRASGPPTTSATLGAAGAGPSGAREQGCSCSARPGRAAPIGPHLPAAPGRPHSAATVADAVRQGFYAASSPTAAGPRPARAGTRAPVRAVPGRPGRPAGRAPTGSSGSSTSGPPTSGGGST